MADFTGTELTILRDALGEYMTDAYGTENAEGCWSPEQWKQLQAIDEKLSQLERVGTRVYFTFLTRTLTGRIEAFTSDGNVKIVSKGYAYSVSPENVGRAV